MASCEWGCGADLSERGRGHAYVALEVLLVNALLDRVVRAGCGDGDSRSLVQAGTALSDALHERAHGRPAAVPPLSVARWKRAAERTLSRTGCERLIEGFLAELHPSHRAILLESRLLPAPAAAVA